MKDTDKAEKGRMEITRLLSEAAMPKNIVQILYMVSARRPVVAQTTVFGGYIQTSNQGWRPQKDLLSAPHFNLHPILMEVTKIKPASFGSILPPPASKNTL